MPFKKHRFDTTANSNAARYSGFYSAQINEHMYAMQKEVSTNYHKFTNYKTREWYHSKIALIPELLDTMDDKTLDKQSKVAYSIREETRTQARDLMADDKRRAEIEIKYPSRSYEWFIQHNKTKYNVDENGANEKIIERCTATNSEFDEATEEERKEKK